MYSVSQKNPSPAVSDICLKQLGIFNQFLHTYCMFLLYLR